MPLANSQTWFSDHERVSLSWLRKVCEEHRESITSVLAPLLFPGASLPAAASTAGEVESPVERFWGELLLALAGETAPMAARLSAYGSYSACSGSDLRSLSEGLDRVRGHLLHLLIETYGDTPRKLEGALVMLLRLFDHALQTITSEYRLHREALMEEQRQREAIEHRRAVELEAENLRIQAASRLKSEFLANMSHELRTPLNSIIGFADLLHDREVTPESPQHHEFLGDILKSARHLLKLINDVLDLAKVEAGKMEFRPDDIDLSLLVSEVSDVLHSQAIGRRVSLRHEIASDVQAVYADPARLRQVLYNYLSNAIKFTPAGGSVTIRAFGVGAAAFRIEVEDTGIGISLEDQQRLFVEFEQLVHGDGYARSGTGLGLALTRRIVEAQGGEVGVRSVLGEGSTFWVSLPAEHDRERAPRASSYFEQLRPSSAPPRSGRGA